MRQSSISLLLLVFFSALAVSKNEQASAQATPVQSEGQRVNASLAEFSAWNQQMQEVVVETVHVMQATPHPPAGGLDAAGRRQWAANARTWAEQARATFADARVKASRLTPPPRSDLAPAAFFDALEQQRIDLPHVIDSCDQLANSYSEFADAVERNNLAGVPAIRARGIDAGILVLRLFHDSNEGQAGGVPSTHPQQALLLSAARSYEGLIAILTYKRGLIDNPQSDRLAPATRIEEAAQAMREYALTGRAAAQTLIQRYSAVSVDASDTAAQSLQRRAIQLLQTYAGSFDRETAMAGELQAIATLLRDPRSIAAVEPEIDRHTEMFGVMDNDRLVDATRRQAIMSQN